MSRLAVAVVGLGSFGQNHLRVLRELPDVEVAAVVDTHRSNRRWDVPRSRICGSFSDGVEAAVLAVPTRRTPPSGARCWKPGLTFWSRDRSRPICSPPAN